MDECSGFVSRHRKVSPVRIRAPAQNAYIMEHEEHRKGLLSLKHGERYVFSESDYGRAEVWRLNGTLILYSIPAFGGLPIFEKTYEFGEYEDKRADAIDEIICTVDGWC